MKHQNKSSLLAVLLTAFLAVYAAWLPQCRADASLTNGLISYWPMDVINGGTVTPDLVSGFDLAPFSSTDVGTGIPVSFSQVTISLTNDAVRGNAFVFTGGSNVLAYVASGANPYTQPLPPTANPNFTISFWVKADPTVAGNGGSEARVYADCDLASGQGNSFYDVSMDSTTGQIDHFVRQGASTVGALTFGNFTGGTHEFTTNATLFTSPAAWHNITIVQQVITNLDVPVIDLSQFMPFPGTVNLVWNSEALDSAFGNNTNQVDTNQQYLIYRATNVAGPWTNIATVAALGPNNILNYTDSSAPLSNAFYTVVKPGVRLSQETVYVDLTNVDYDFTGSPYPNGANYLQYGIWKLSTTTFGGYLRGSSAPAGAALCEIDDAAVWNRALTSNEISHYMKDGITNVSGNIPLAASLTEQFPAVAYGDTLDLSWTASKPPATLAIAPQVGDVTAISSQGVGSTNVVVYSNTTFTLTATRSGLTTNSSVAVTCVSNVSPNWHYIDSFTYLPDGPINGQGRWSNPNEGYSGEALAPLEVYTANTNNYASFDGGVNGGIAGRELASYASEPGTSNTLFFRFVIDANLANNGNPNDPNVGGGDVPDVDVNLGLCDQGIRDPNDLENDNSVGLAIIRNVPGNGAAGVAFPPPIDLQLQNGPADYGSSGLTPNSYSYVGDTTTFPDGSSTNGLTPGHVYNVWIDVQNYAPNVSSGEQTNGALFRVWLQRDDWALRTNLLATMPTSTNSDGSVSVPAGWFVSAREEVSADAVFPQSPVLHTLFMTMNNGVSEQTTNMLRFDDFYISTNGLNSTLPVVTQAPVNYGQ